MDLCGLFYGFQRHQQLVRFPIVVVFERRMYASPKISK